MSLWIPFFTVAISFFRVKFWVATISSAAAAIILQPNSLQVL
jgi:hypothetical protein